jgi:proline iminopeptidase
MRRLTITALTLAAAIACRDAQPVPAPVAAPPAPTATAPEGFIDVPGGKVFYRVMGGGERTPLILLHGGPGGRSCAFEVLSELATDRKVIRYDQLGSGKSDRPNDLSLWTTERFVEELDTVRRALGLREVHILGHSWGGTLATEYLLTKGQDGVVSAMLSSPLISTPRWLADANRLRGTLPKPVQAALDQCEAVETADDPKCREANAVFEEHFVRGAKSLPAVPACDGVTGGDQVYRHMWGAAEFTATGTLRDYDRSHRLGELKLPVLFLAGRNDEAAPETIADFQSRVPGAKMAVLEKSAHSTYRTETAEYVRIVRAFLDEAESNHRRK